MRDAQKARLMHAGVRYWLLDVARRVGRGLGRRCIQEDLAGTLMAFTVGVLQGVERLGVTVFPWQEEAYLHAWKIVGALMGLDADLLPANMAGGPGADGADASGATSGPARRARSCPRPRGAARRVGPRDALPGASRPRSSAT